MTKKILVMPDGNWLSHVSRPFEIARKLRDMGHSVVFAGDGQYMKLPREAGFRIIPVKTINPDRVLKCSRRGRANWYDYELIESCVRSEMALFHAYKPDLVLTDFRLTLSTSCELALIPLAVTLNASWTDYYGVKIRAPEHLWVTQLFGRKATSLFIPWIKKFIVSFDCRPFNQFRRQNGLRPRKTIWDVWRGDINLIVDIPEYGPTKNLPGNFHYIGPIVWEPQMAPPKWLDALDANRFTIYFTMGSTGHPRFFEQAMGIFGHSDYQCLMTTAGMVNLSNIPDNFYVVDYAPGSKLMEKSDVVVCQGGNGTIYQAMMNGVPIIGIPTMHDQEFNLDRVAEMGIGIHLSELRFKPNHLTDSITKIREETSYKTNVQKYERILRNYDGPATGAEIISSYLK